MGACEKCWTDAAQAYAVGRGVWESKVDAYRYFINERRDNPCTPEQQRGELHSDDWSPGRLG